MKNVNLHFIFSRTWLIFSRFCILNPFNRLQQLWSCPVLPSNKTRLFSIKNLKKVSKNCRCLTMAMKFGSRKRIWSLSIQLLVVRVHRLSKLESENLNSEYSRETMFEENRWKMLELRFCLTIKCRKIWLRRRKKSMQFREDFIASSN